jgi:hypothetical protein
MLEFEWREEKRQQTLRERESRSRHAKRVDQSSASTNRINLRLVSVNPIDS